MFFSVPGQVQIEEQFGEVQASSKRCQPAVGPVSDLDLQSATLQEQKHIIGHADAEERWSKRVTEYIQSIYKKLNVPNAPSAISKAYKSGILPSDNGS